MRVTFGLLLISLTLPLFHTSTADEVEVESNVTIDDKVYKFAQGWWDSSRKSKWYENYWRNNKKVLLHKAWNQKGILQSETTFHDDYLHGPYRSYFDATGKLAVEATYKEGAYDGVVKKYYESGKLRDQVTYRAGIRDGRWTRFHTDGIRPKFTGTFANGRPKAEFVETNEDGKVLRRIAFKDGRTEFPTQQAPTLTKAALRFATGGHEGWDFNFLVHEDGTASLAGMEMIARVRTNKDKRQGLAVGTFYYDTVDRIATFRLSTEDHIALAAKLKDLDILSLKDKYVDSDVDDGTQWHVLVKLDGKSKSIYCSNKFPSDLEKLRVFLVEEILPHYELEQETARIEKSFTVSREVTPP